jgi:vacuolar-type H+-ATPase subunit I/STV1
LDPQAAIQVFTTLLQIGATFFAVYLAVIIFIFQAKKVAKELIGQIRFKASFFLSWVAFLVFMISCFYNLVVWSPSIQVSDVNVIINIFTFIINCLSILVVYWRVMKAIEETSK